MLILFSCYKIDIVIYFTGVAAARTAARTGSADAAPHDDADAAHTGVDDAPLGDTARTDIAPPDDDAPHADAAART